MPSSAARRLEACRLNISMTTIRTLFIFTTVLSVRARPDIHNFRRKGLRQCGRSMECQANPVASGFVLISSILTASTKIGMSCRNFCLTAAAALPLKYPLPNRDALPAQARHPACRQEAGWKSLLELLFFQSDTAGIRKGCGKCHTCKNIPDTIPADAANQLLIFIIVLHFQIFPINGCLPDFCETFCPCFTTLSMLA